MAESLETRFNGGMVNIYRNALATGQLALVKSTRIREGVSLELRAEALNALNHPLWGGDPILATNNPNFGKLLLNNGQTNEPRQVQLSARIVF